MKLSTKGRYGVKALVDLAVHDNCGPISVKSISERQHISEYYLEQLFSPLRKAGLIKSIRGAQGGYILGKSPDEIYVQDIIDVVEGPIEISTCLSEDSCDNIGGCPTRNLWKKIQDSIYEVTSTTTLKNIIEGNDKRSK